MLLSLRSKLWGTRTGPGSISGTGASVQSSQTNAGNCLWYSPILHRVHYLGTSIKKLLEQNDPFHLIPVEGEGGTQQGCQQSAGVATLGFSGEGATARGGQFTEARGYVIRPVLGGGATRQQRGYCQAEAEHVDVELEIIAAVLAAV